MRGSDRRGAFGALTVVMIAVTAGLVAAPRAPEPDRVVFTNLASATDPGSVEPAVIYSGLLDGACVQHEVRTGLGSDGSIALGDVGTSGECPPRLYVLSRWRGAWATSRAWGTTGQSGEVLRVALPDPVPVRVHIFIVAAANNIDVTLFDLSVDHAVERFADLWTGVSLDVTPRREVTPRFGEWVDPESTWANLIGSGCDSAWRLAHTAGAPYEPDALNVYLVNEVYDDPVGYTCLKRWVVSSVTTVPSMYHDVDAPNVIFLSYDFRFTTLAHEIGHALGLYAPEAVSGHTNDEVLSGMGFHPQNLMSKGLAYSVEEVTLGQAFRINYDLRSWLVTRRTRRIPGAVIGLVPGLGPSAHPFVLLFSGLQQPRPRVCDSDPRATWPCPPLNLGTSAEVP